MWKVEYKKRFLKELSKLPEEQADEFKIAVAETKGAASQSALADMAMFPAIMLFAYIALFLYFRSKGGYKPHDMEQMSGGVEGPVR